VQCKVRGGPAAFFAHKQPVFLWNSTLSTPCFLFQFKNVILATFGIMTGGVCVLQWRTYHLFCALKSRFVIRTVMCGVPSGSAILSVEWNSLLCRSGEQNEMVYQLGQSLTLSRLHSPSSFVTQKCSRRKERKR
jgi:hypothetical protein